MRKTAYQLADAILYKCAIDLQGLRNVTKGMFRRGEIIRGGATFRGDFANPHALKQPLTRRAQKFDFNNPHDAAYPRGETTAMVMPPDPDAPILPYIQHPGVPKNPVLTGGKGHSHLQYVQQLSSGMGPTLKNPTPESREVLNRLLLLHEGTERGVLNANPGYTVNKMVKSWGSNLKPEAATVLNHLSPDVLLKEHNMVSTLPKEYDNVRDYMTKLRGIDGGHAQMYFKLPQRFDYGTQRISRHARRRMLDILRNSELTYEDLMRGKRRN